MKIKLLTPVTLILALSLSGLSACKALDDLRKDVDNTAQENPTPKAPKTPVFGIVVRSIKSARLLGDNVQLPDEWQVDEILQTMHYCSSPKAGLDINKLFTTVYVPSLKTWRGLVMKLETRNLEWNYSAADKTFMGAGTFSWTSELKLYDTEDKTFWMDDLEEELSFELPKDEIGTRSLVRYHQDMGRGFALAIDVQAELAIDGEDTLSEICPPQERE